MGKKVRAIQLGYYNNRRYREGEEFELNEDKDYSSKWMQPSSEAPKSAKKSHPKGEKASSSKNKKDEEVI